MTFLISLFLFISPYLYLISTNSLPVCRNSCDSIKIDYPFGIDDGCGAPLYRNMLTCSTLIPTTTTNTNNNNTFLTPIISTPPPAITTITGAGGLYFETPSGNYKVESINYDSQTLTIYDPSMSTCTILQPHHDFIMSDIQSAIIPPSPDTIFALLNCSIDSPVFHHYKSLCFNLSSRHSCDELYTSCTSFKIFKMFSNDTGTTPGCCFTSYATLKFMSMNILDCTHYTSFYDYQVDKEDDILKPLDWSYGIKVSYSLPHTGCDRCRKSGGTCGFDVETEGMLCICSPTLNSTRQCGAGTIAAAVGTRARLHGVNGLLLLLPFLYFSLRP